ncbi:MAG: hypothetical protein O3A02_03625, partial [bacterium]|nr:hypothetical protein [bacterium]
TARPLVGNDLDDGLLGTPLPQMAAIERASRGPAPARMTMTAHNLRTEAARVELVRLDAAAGRGARSAALLPLDAKSIRDGFVWHQVLGAPRSRRKLGGGPFPER